MNWSQEARASINKALAKGQAIDTTPTKAREPIPEFERESQFQAAIEKECRKRCWLYYHTHDSRRSKEGFPDLVMLRNGWQIVAELKVGDNKPGADQQTWQEAFEEVAGRAPNVIYCLWYPEDWPTILAMLDNPAPFKVIDNTFRH